MSVTSSLDFDPAHALCFLRAGFIARDVSKGMGVENSTYMDHEMEYVLQRYDQVGAPLFAEACLLFYLSHLESVYRTCTNFTKLKSNHPMMT